MINLDEAETGFQYVMQAYKIGGVFMNLITIFGLIALGITLWKVIEIVRKRNVNTRLLDLVKMSAWLAISLGFLSQVVGIVRALEAIKAAADISAEIVMNGAIVSFYAPIWGLIVFIFSMIFYYVLKVVVKARMS
ncbi:MAG TPA: MotA/TolQ/ExbB proton channel family protein [Draconibacterium sp.]|nr:MotA/TolQ/ExbB proton channel family protein [Draconibacterium sp.]